MKTVILSGGVTKQMSYEDILVQFDPMLHQFANTAIEKMVFNAPEKEEIMQELRIQTWEAYRRYNGVNAFSTYLVPRLQHGVHRATTKLYAQKRTNKNGVVSLHKLLGSAEGETELEGFIGEEDVELMSYDFRELLCHLNETLDKSERIMLRVLLDKNEFSVRDLADELGISRQGANKKFNKFKEKMAEIMKNIGYVAC